MANSSTSVRNFVPLANKYDRVILLIDMDCFYCQVEERLDPSLKNQPLAVVQYNAWRGGGIIAVNYAARAKGVTRHMRGDEAKEQCPEIQLVKVPNVREKADLTKYREAGKEVANVLQQFTPLLERASVDEAYLDITDAVNKRLQEMNEGEFVFHPEELLNTYAVGYQTIAEFVTTITTSFITDPLPDNDTFYRNFHETDLPAVRQSNIRLLIGACIANEIRAAVKAETSYECSAGIAHNKILAKLACGINKPNKQTLLPLMQIPTLFETLPVGKIKGLGAKFGEEVCEHLNIRYLGQMLKFTEAELQKKLDEKNGTWLYYLCRGIDLEAVTPRFYSKSIGCCKKFPGRNNITGLKTLEHWLNELANEIHERLEKDISENNRRAKQMVVSFIQEFDNEEISSSRSAPLQCYDSEMLAKTSLEVIRANTKHFFRSGSESALNNPIKFLGISVTKFERISNSQNNILKMFAQQTAKKQKLQIDSKNEKQTLTLMKIMEKDDQKSDVMENIGSCNNTNQHTSIKDIKSSQFLAAVAVKSDTTVIPQTDNRSEYNSQKEIPKEKNSPKIKSFFLNALKKKSHTEINNSNPMLNNQNQLNSIPRNELITSSENDNSDGTNKEISKSFFVKALQRKLESNGIKAAGDFSFENSNSNKNQNSETKNSNSNEKNYLLNEINSIENEVNICNSDLQVSENVNTGPINKKRKHDKTAEFAENTQTDYRLHYAEFAIPELNTEFLQFINCSKCGAKIVNDPLSIQTHDDHHIAQELSNQQRQEYRNEMRLKMNTTKSPPNRTSNKKSKIVNNGSRKTSTDIKKFLQPSSFPVEPSPTATNTANMEICSICKLCIKIDEVSEHKDFHMAKDLQRQLNQLEVRTIDATKSSPSNSSRKSTKSRKRHRSYIFDH